MRYSLDLVGFAGIGMFAAFVALAAVNPQIEAYIEEPQDDTFYQGVSNLRGWAVAPIELDRVEAYLDGEYMFDVPLGGNRLDVANHPTHGQYPNAAHSGFSMALNYGNYALGPHVLSIRAIDVNGDYTDRSRSFDIVSFPNSYMNNHPRTPVVLVDQPETGFVLDADGDAFCIQGMWVEGMLYDVCLRWRNEVQGFAIEEISSP